MMDALCLGVRLGESLTPGSLGRRTRPDSSLISPASRLVAVVQVLSCLTLYDPVDCSKPGFSVLHYLLEFALIHVH